jgi:RTX calcium-binding nonapeptide repeat (4 copies)
MNVRGIDREASLGCARILPRKRTATALALAVALVLSILSTPAAPTGQIVLHGAASGSTLKLSVHGPRLVAKGLMARAHPSGCRFKRFRMIAVCRLSGAGAIEVDMGPSGDFVKVKDRLPLPLTVHLGGGSDKFVGNGERDTCYSEGARRNRCVGGPNNDICITGQQNSDCVGGSGDDYCKHGAGSDGCWGGPGNDICLMGPGHDGCHGGPGRDRLYGGPSSDQLYGGRAFDRCDGLPGRGRSHSCEAGPKH